MGMFVYIENIVYMNSFILHSLEQVTVDLVTGKFGKIWQIGQLMGCLQYTFNYYFCDIFVENQIDAHSSF